MNPHDSQFEDVPVDNDMAQQVIDHSAPIGQYMLGRASNFTFDEDGNPEGMEMQIVLLIGTHIHADDEDETCIQPTLVSRWPLDAFRRFVTEAQELLAGYDLSEGDRNG